MASTLRLEMADYLDTMHWSWRLSDSRGRFLAGHEVRLDPNSPEYRAFLNLRGYLDYHEPIYKAEAQLAELGAWIGEQVFGGLLDALWRNRGSPAMAVQVKLLPEAHELLRRPSELACFDDSTNFREAGIRIVYQVGDVPARRKDPVGERLRILAAFSLPVRTNP